MVFLKLIPMIFYNIFSLFLQPIFWIVLLIIWFQFKRLAKVKSDMFNIGKESVIVPTLVASFYGLVGGVLGSFILVLAGISVLEVGIQYLWVLAIILMFINQRFMCFAYSGGILAFCNYFFGFPEISIPQVMGLVAILHLVEALLILMSGHLGAVPVYVKDKQGRVVGGFSLQKFWPLPIVAMIAMTDPSGSMIDGVIKMPEWWPLIKSNLVLESDNIVYVMMPIIAGIGYGDIALTGRPKVKSLISAYHLALFSISLLFLAIISTHYPELGILAALFSPLGHEFVIYLGRKYEFNRTPKFVAPEKGIMVLDLLNNSPLKKAGVGVGDIILSIGENEVNHYYELDYALQFTGSKFYIDYIDDDTGKIRRSMVKRKKYEVSLGLITVPEGYSHTYVNFFDNDSFLKKIFKKVFK